MVGRLSARQKIVNLVTVAVILVILGVVLYLARTNAANAEVGDCLKETGSNSFEQVECGSAEAAFKVVGRVEHKRESETSGACDPFQDQGAAQAHWTGRSGRSGTVLCLAEAVPTA